MDAFKKAVAKIDRLMKIARWLKIDVAAQITPPVSYSLRHSKWEHSWNASVPVTAASINKLAVALLWLHRPGSDRFAWHAEDVRPGTGVYDAPGAPRHATAADLMIDMLVRSGNTAMVVLGRHRVGEINGLLRRLGDETGTPLQTTMLLPKEFGFFDSGVTTPAGALNLLTMVATDGSESIRKALVDSHSYVPATSGMKVLSKHGALNGPDNDGVFVRNEVGVITGGIGQAGAYAVFTQTSSHLKAKLAERLIGRIGTIVATSVAREDASFARSYADQLPA